MAGTTAPMKSITSIQRGGVAKTRLHGGVRGWSPPADSAGGFGSTIRHVTISPVNLVLLGFTLRFLVVHKGFETNHILKNCMDVTLTLSRQQSSSKHKIVVPKLQEKSRATKSSLHCTGKVRAYI